MSPPAPSRSTSKIAATFARAALGPIDYATTCITSNKILTGLTELGPEGLFEAFERGVGDVAKLVGVSRAAVLDGLPEAELRSVRQRLSSSHPAALDAWRMHAGQFGFLDVVTALTVDGRRPDIRTCLERVAKKVKADRALSEPLGALAADVDAWTELLERARTELQSGTALASALQKKRMVRAIVLTVPTLLLMSLTATIVFVRIQREDVDRKLAAPDPCVAYDLTETELAYASSAQRDVLGGLLKTCDVARAELAEKKRLDDARLAAEKRALEEKQARERACAGLADDVEKGALGETSRAAAKGSAALLDRVARKALEPADVGPAPPAFPCADSPALPRLEKAFARALLADVSIWTQRGNPSPYLSTALGSVKSDIPINALLGLADNAERTAKSGLSGGDVGKLERAKHLCALAKALDSPGRSACAAVLVMK